MSYTLSEKTDLLIKHIQGENVKGKLEVLIEQYNKGKEDIPALLNVKDEFNQLSFYLGSLFGKAKDIIGHADLQAQEAFNKEYLSQRSEVNEDTGRLKSVEDCKLSARLKTAESTIVNLQADVALTYIRSYMDTCKSYRDACQQRVPVLKEEIFSSRQQV